MKRKLGRLFARVQSVVMRIWHRFFPVIPEEPQLPATKPTTSRGFDAVTDAEYEDVADDAWGLVASPPASTETPVLEWASDPSEADNRAARASELAAELESFMAAADAENTPSFDAPTGPVPEENDVISGASLASDDADFDALVAAFAASSDVAPPTAQPESESPESSAPPSLAQSNTGAESELVSSHSTSEGFEHEAARESRDDADEGEAGEFHTATPSESAMADDEVGVADDGIAMADEAAGVADATFTDFDDSANQSVGADLADGAEVLDGAEAVATGELAEGTNEADEPAMVDEVDPAELTAGAVEADEPAMVDGADATELTAGAVEADEPAMLDGADAAELTAGAVDADESAMVDGADAAELTAGADGADGSAMVDRADAAGLTAGAAEADAPAMVDGADATEMTAGTVEADEHGMVDGGDPAEMTAGTVEADELGMLDGADAAELTTGTDEANESAMLEGADTVPRAELADDSDADGVEQVAASETAADVSAEDESRDPSELDDGAAEADLHVATATHGDDRELDEDDVDMSDIDFGDDAPTDDIATTPWSSFAVADAAAYTENDTTELDAADASDSTEQAVDHASDADPITNLDAVASDDGVEAAAGSDTADVVDDATVTTTADASADVPELSKPTFSAAEAEATWDEVALAELTADVSEAVPVTEIAAANEVTTPLDAVPHTADADDAALTAAAEHIEAEAAESSGQPDTVATAAEPANADLSDDAALTAAAEHIEVEAADSANADLVDDASLTAAAEHIEIEAAEPATADLANDAAVAAAAEHIEVEAAGSSGQPDAVAHAYASYDTEPVDEAKLAAADASSPTDPSGQPDIEAHVDALHAGEATDEVDLVAAGADGTAAAEFSDLTDSSGQPDIEAHAIDTSEVSDSVESSASPDSMEAALAAEMDAVVVEEHGAPTEDVASTLDADAIAAAEQTLSAEGDGVGLDVAAAADAAADLDAEPDAPPPVAAEIKAIVPPMEIPSDYIPVAESSHALYQLQLDGFEGPLDLLLHLIKRHNLDIFDIPIAFICEQYLKLIKTMEDLDIDVAAEFLYMASELLQIKSRMLLPKPEGEAEEEDDIDPRAELVRRLLEYQKYKDAAEQFASLDRFNRDIFGREAEDPPPALGEAPLKEVGLFALVKAFEGVLKRGKPEVRHQVMIEHISVRARIRVLLTTIEQHADEGLRFDHLLADAQRRLDIVVTFLALLEMGKMKLLRIMQDEDGVIYLSPKFEDIGAAFARIEGIDESQYA